MRKWKLWLLLGSSSFLVFFLLLVATAAGSFADDVTAAFGGRQASASESRTPIKATYVGVDDTDTDFSGCVIPETRRVLDGPVWQILGGVTLLAVWGLAIWWTYAPPQLPLFVDPTDGSRGIPLR